MSSIIREVVVSISRNIDDYPFPNALDKESKKELAGKVASSLEKSSIKFNKFDLSTLDRVDILSILQKFYFSTSIADDIEGKLVFISEDESICILVNGENHIKIISKLKGLELESAYSKAKEIETNLSNDFNFAFSKELGYLTPNLSILGTAMKASVVLHLVGLKKNDAISKISTNLSKLGLIINPLFSKESNPCGDMYSLSNAVTLGISEESAIENLKNITMQLENREEDSRKKLVEKISIQDLIFRSYGILKNARIVEYSEGMNMLSALRLGVSCNLIDYDIEKVDELINLIHPIKIIEKLGEDAYEDIDVKRAEIIREYLN